MLLNTLSNIDPSRLQKANLCNVSLEKVFHTINKQLIGKKFIDSYKITLKFNVISDNKTPHTVFIQLSPDYNCNLVGGNDVKISCDCDDFKYRCSFTLNKSNNLFTTGKIETALAQALTVAPKKTPITMCKHVYAAVNYLINNYNNIMKSC